MNKQVARAFLLLIAVQAAHSIEEFIFRLFDVFPPMRFAYQRAPELAKSAFVIFNVLLVAFGLYCYFRWVKHGRTGTRTVIWIWLVLEGINLIIRAVWTGSAMNYTPGLVTAFFLIAALANLLYTVLRWQR